MATHFELQYMGEMESHYLGSPEDLAKLFGEMRVTGYSPEKIEELYSTITYSGGEIMGRDIVGNLWAMKRSEAYLNLGGNFPTEEKRVAWINDEGDTRISVEWDESDQPESYEDWYEYMTRKPPFDELTSLYTVKVWPLNADPGYAQVRGPEWQGDWSEKWYEAWTAPRNWTIQDKFCEDSTILFKRYLFMFMGTETFFEWENGDELYMTFDTEEWRNRMGGKVDARDDFDRYMRWAKGPGYTLVLEKREHHCWSEMSYKDGEPKRIHHDMSQWVIQGKRSGFHSHNLTELGVWGRRAFNV